MNTEIDYILENLPKKNQLVGENNKYQKIKDLSLLLSDLEYACLRTETFHHTSPIQRLVKKRLRSENKNNHLTLEDSVLLERELLKLKSNQDVLNVTENEPVTPKQIILTNKTMKDIILDLCRGLKLAHTTNKCVQRYLESSWSLVEGSGFEEAHQKILKFFEEFGWNYEFCSFSSDIDEKSLLWKIANIEI